MHPDGETGAGQRLDVPGVVLVPVGNEHAAHAERTRGVDEGAPHARKAGVDHRRAHDIGAHVEPQRAAGGAAHANALDVAEALEGERHLFPPLSSRAARLAFAGRRAGG